MWKTIKNEIKFLLKEISNLDKKTIVIFLSIAIFQTISWYYSSRKFYNQVLYSFFPKSFDAELNEFLYWFVSDTIVLFLLPFLIIKLFFKEKVKEYGINFKNFRAGIIIVIILSLIIQPLTYMLSNSEEFANFYPMYNNLGENIKVFLLYETFFLLFLFAWEFIWRGYMLFGLEKKFGWYSILFQMLPFVILHNGKPVLETFGSIFGALLLGVLALRTRSMVYGFLLHASVIVSLDLYALLK